MIKIYDIFNLTSVFEALGSSVIGSPYNIGLVFKTFFFWWSWSWLDLVGFGIDHLRS